MKTDKLSLLLSMGFICFLLLMPFDVSAKSRIVSGSTIRNLNKPAPKKAATRRLSVNFKNNNIRAVFKKLEPYCGCTYVLDQTVQGKVTLRIKRASCKRIVDIILARNNLKAVSDGAVVRVFPEIKTEPEKTEKPLVVTEREEIKPKAQKDDHKEPQKQKERKKAYKGSRKPKKQNVVDSKRKYYVGFSGIYSIQFLDDDQTKDKFTGDLNVSFDDSFGFQLKGGYVFNNVFATEVVVDYLLPFETTLDSGKDELSVINFSFNGKATYPFIPTIKPYGIAGLGLLNAYEDISYAGETYQTNDWGMSLRFGSGVDLPVARNISVGCEASYCIGVGDIDHISFLKFSLGAIYKF